MNNTTKIIAATLITLASSVSIAETEFYARAKAIKIGGNFEQGYMRSLDGQITSLLNSLEDNRIIIQFNVKSTNKSRYNAVYLAPARETIDPVNGDFCEPVGHNPDEESAGSVEGEPVLVTYLPYSPHNEVHNNEEWLNGSRSVHKVVRVPDWMSEGADVVLRFCSRDKNGDVTGDLDNVEITDLVIHYNTKDEET